MVHVFERQEGVQRSVDGCGDGVVSERADWIHSHHFVLKLDAPITASERMNLVQVQGREAVSLNAADIAAASFDPQNFLFGTLKRIGIEDLGAGIAATEVGDAKIGTQ